MLHRVCCVVAVGLGITAIASGQDGRSLSAPTPIEIESASAETEGPGAPDVWVCTIPSSFYWGQSGGIHAFSIGTTSANAGNVDLNWVQVGTQHPVIAQNIYRLKDNVMEMVGMSWLKHGFCALQQNLPGCGSCDVIGGCVSFLRPGCADPYSATLNGGTNGLGPRSEVNPTTGAFVWPFSTGSTSTPSVLRSRVQVKNADISPALNPGARWFAEGQYVHPQDAQAGLDNNNASTRELRIADFSFNPNSTVQQLGSTFGMMAAIEVWKALVPAVQLSYVDVPGVGNGRVIVASLAQDNGDGTWDYEYAVFNMNCDRAVGAFTVPADSGLTLTNIGFRDVAYHSGEPYDGTDWPGAHTGDDAAWATTPHAVNPNANAIRWSTMYNFRFTADAAPDPAGGTATLGLFKPGGVGDPDTASAAIVIPLAPACIGDFNGDGSVGGLDLLIILNEFGNGPNGNGNPIGSPAADINGDGVVNGTDLLLLLNNFGDCP